ncbi:MAG: ZIP family metal transporter [bacterium]|nr:ZIP family metal transporter [bacterium]
MNDVWFYSLISVFIVSLISLVGIIGMALSHTKLKKILLLLVSFSAGTLFGGAFIHLLPEAVEEFGFGIEVSLYLLAGIVLFFVLEKVIHWRHCHIPTSKDHPHPLAFMNLIGDGLHNFIDGMIIAGSYLVSVPLGITTTIAVILHEIPQEIGDFGVLLHAGFSRKKAVLFNFFSALLAVAGAVFAIIIGSKIEGFSMIIVPLTAGGFIYIAGSDLIPELKKETAPLKSLMQLAAIILGIGVMLLMLLME